MTIITSAVKDNILLYLCDNYSPERMIKAETQVILNNLRIDFDTFNAIMQQFQRIGLIEELSLRSNSCSFILLTEAHDYAVRGGFIAQEELIIGNIEKLILEIEHLKKRLKPDQLDTVNKIAGIASSIVSGISLFKK